MFLKRVKLKFKGQFLPFTGKTILNFVTFSITEAEYVATGACCAQVLWMKHTLLDYDLRYDHVKIICDNTSTIHMIKNTNQHSKT